MADQLTRVSADKADPAYREDCGRWTVMWEGEQLDFTHASKIAVLTADSAASIVRFYRMSDQFDRTKGEFPLYEEARSVTILPDPSGVGGVIEIGRQIASGAA